MKKLITPFLLFSALVGLAAVTGIPYLPTPTNNGTDGQLPSKTGGSMKWVTVTGTVPSNVATNDGDNAWSALQTFNGGLRSPSMYLSNLYATNSYLNLANSTNMPAASMTGVVTNWVDATTNLWLQNTEVTLGTSGYGSMPSATLGITGLLNAPTTTARYAELSIKAGSGDVTFTNPVSFATSDYVSTRTITNGNRCEIAIKVVPGMWTNMAIVQFK